MQGTEYRARLKSLQLVRDSSELPPKGEYISPFAAYIRTLTDI